MSKTALRLVGPVLAVLFGLGVAWKGTAVEAVLVELLPGAEEAGDGLGAGAPDYRLEVKVGPRWVECETLKGTPIGEGLRIELPSPVARGQVTELRLVEDDKLRDDVLEELPVEGDQVEGVAYRFTLETAWSLGAGIERFLETPMGILLAMGLGLAIVTGAAALALRRSVG